MASLMVSLLICLLAGTSRAAFPMFNGLGFGMGNMFQHPFQNPYQNQNQQQVNPYLMTCLGADAQDFQSQIRLSIEPIDHQPQAQNPFGHPALGLPGLRGMGNMGRSGKSTPRDWTVRGILLPSRTVNKAGTYQMAVFSGGRTFGECKAPALGHVLTTSNGHPFGGRVGFGVPSPYSPLGMGMGLNPFASMLGLHGLQQQQQPAGMISNNAIVGTGTTVYTGMIRQVSYNQLLGTSIGACQAVRNGQCMGLIAFCCSITRDTLPADEVFVEQLAQQPGNIGFNSNPFGGQQGGGFQNSGGLQASSPFPVGGGSIGVIDNDGGDNSGGLF